MQRQPIIIIHIFDQAHCNTIFNTVFQLMRLLHFPAAESTRQKIMVQISFQKERKHVYKRQNTEIVSEKIVLISDKFMSFAIMSVSKQLREEVSCYRLSGQINFCF